MYSKSILYQLMYCIILLEMMLEFIFVNHFLYITTLTFKRYIKPLKNKLFDRLLFLLSIIVFCVEKCFFLNPNSIYRGKVIDWCGQALEDALNSQTLDKNTKKNSKEVNKNTNSNPFHLFSKKLFYHLFLSFRWKERMSKKFTFEP